MTKYKLTLVFSIVMISGMWCQTNFEPGHFVNTKNEVVNCLIKNKRWLQSPAEFVYKLTEAHRSVFLKQLVFGQANLYEFREGNDTAFAYTLDDKPMIILLYGESVDSGNKIRKINTFRNQLYKEVICGNSKKIQKLKYERVSLESYFKEYNNCSAAVGKEVEEETVVENKPKSILSFKVWAGAQRYDFAVAAGSQLLDYDKTITPKIGIELENIFPYNNNKWAVFLSAAYTSHSSEALLNNGNGFEIVGSEFELSRLEVSFAGRHYMFLNDKSSFFIEGGTAFDFDLKTNLTGAGFLQTESRTEGSKVNFAIITGVGYSYNQSFYSRINYYLDQNILTFIRVYKNKLSRLSLSIGYKF